MASEAVKVIVRCRPLNQREKDLNSKVVVTMDNGHDVSIVNPHDSSAPPKTFRFDGAYFMNSTTEQIYNDITYELVESVIEGYNGTVFAYGQTGCGKSFSMQGVSEPASQRGIIPRAFEHIFEAIATSEDAKFLVHASYLEIYKEEIRDLLGKETKKKLELKQHPEKGAYIPDLSLHPVHDVKECERIMERGWRNRSVGSTLMNADSSRSHSIFTVSVEKMKTNDGEGEDSPIKRGKLNLVDLAGSERQAKTGCTGDRLKEATKINLSLSALGNVISALVDGKSSHIPYRDSKLTRLLEDSLGGNTKTLMVACLSPADNNYEESLSTLRYANRAKNIQNKPKVNEDPKDALLREYQEEINRLKAMLAGQEMKEENGNLIIGNNNEGKISMLPDSNEEVRSVPQEVPPPSANWSEAAIEEERQRLKMEYEQMMQDLRQKYAEEKKSNAKLQEDVQRLKQQYEEEVQNLNAQSKNGQGKHVAVTTSTAEAMTDGSIGQEEILDAKPQMNLDDALKRLQELEEQMVGGEKANDKELKEKRMKKKKAAEKRLRVLADALHQVDEDDKAMLMVYDNIQEELKAKTELLKKEKQRVRVLEREIKDLQSEFEYDRMDYLDTIRRQDQQIRLLQQILDKIQPCLRRDCNYSNLERVKAESTWDEDHQKWKLPDLIIVKTKLPPAGVQPGARAITRSAHSLNGIPQHADDENGEDKFLQKLERGEQEDIAGKYFKPKRAKELLLKAQEEAQRLSQILEFKRFYNDLYEKDMKSSIINNNNNNNYLYSASIPRDGPYFMTSSQTGNTPLTNGSSANSVPNGSYSGPASPELTIRKPMRLEALPLVGDMSKRSKRKKNGFVTTTYG